MINSKKKGNRQRNGERTKRDKNKKYKMKGKVKQIGHILKFMLKN